MQGFENTGVVEKSMPTSRNPPLGDWTIDVTVLVSVFLDDQKKKKRRKKAEEKKGRKKRREDL